MEAVPNLRAGRRPKWFLRAAVAVVASVTSFALASVAVPSTPASAIVEGVILRVTPAGSGVITPGGTLDVTVSITNGSDVALAPGDVDVFFDRSLLDTRAELSTWLSPDPAEDDDPGAPIGSGVTTEILPGTTFVLPVVSLPADSFGLGLSASSFGARGLAAEFTAGGAEIADGRGSVVWYPGVGFAPTNLSVLLPITTPAAIDGFLDSEALAAFTAPTGLLTRQLDAVEARPQITIGIDPRIIASIRVLGSSAPPSAVEWLERLEALPNESFPLAYADADVAVQPQASVPLLLAPTSAEYAIDPTLFETDTTPEEEPEETDPEQDSAEQDGTDQNGTAPPGEAGAPPTDNPTPTATETPEPTTVPTLEDLLDWPYTRQGIAWPAPNTVTASNLATFTASGITTTILDSANVTTASELTPDAAATTGDASVLVSDHEVAFLLNSAMLAATDIEFRDSLSRLTSVLATITREQPGTTRSVVAALDRGWPTSQRVVGALSAINALEWANTAPLAAALDADSPTVVTVVERPEAPERVAAVAALLAAGAQVNAFSIILERPEILTGEQRMRLLALLSVGWREPSTLPSWDDAVEAQQTEVAEILSSVQVSESSTVQALSDTIPLPVRVENALGQAVTVTVTGRALNARAEVVDSTAVTVPPNATQTATLPARSVSNGASTIAVTLYSSPEPGAIQIGNTRLIDVEIRAGWENVAVVAFGVAIVLLFGFGIVRSIRKRRRARDTDATGTEDAPSSQNAPGSQDAPGGTSG